MCVCVSACVHVCGCGASGTSWHLLISIYLLPTKNLVHMFFSGRMGVSMQLTESLL